MKLIEQLDKIQDKIDKIKVKNPETGRENKLKTALNNKDNAAHEKALEIYKKIKLNYKDKNQDNSNKQYIDKIAKSIKIDKNNAKAIKIKLDKAKDEKQFAQIFRKHISNDLKVFDDRFLKLTFQIWNRKDEQNKQPDKSSKNKTKQTKKVAKNYEKDNDYISNLSKNYDNDSDDSSNLSTKDKKRLILLGFLFGGVSKTFLLSKNIIFNINNSIMTDIKNAFEKLND